MLVCEGKPAYEAAISLHSLEVTASEYLARRDYYGRTLRSLAKQYREQKLRTTIREFIVNATLPVRRGCRLCMQSSRITWAQREA